MSIMNDPHAHLHSEGHCPKCRQPLGISGRCDLCAVQEFDLEAAAKRAPKCKQCGAVMVHFRISGYRCSVNRNHTGIVWPEIDQPHKEEPENAGN